MATRVYKTGTVELIDGTKITIAPLKLKYLREFMELFPKIKKTNSEEESLNILLECILVAMKQYFPELDTVEKIEDNMDINNLYNVLEYAADISMNRKEEEVKKEDPEEDFWEKMQLAELEAEAFLLGIWKDYEELESSLSMPELTATLNAKRDADYNEKRFLAAIQGVDLDKDNNRQDEWEKLKNRVFSKGQTEDSNDILALQGVNAEKAGFGLGMGLSYERID
jgi:hypothetical protein